MNTLSSSAFADLSAAGASAAAERLSRAGSVKDQVRRAIVLGGLFTATATAAAPAEVRAQLQSDQPIVVSEQVVEARAEVLGVPMKGHFSLADEMPLGATVTILEEGIRVEFDGEREPLLLPHRTSAGVRSEAGEVETFSLSMGRFQTLEGSPLREFAAGLGVRYFPAESEADLLSERLVEKTGRSSEELLQEAVLSPRVKAAKEIFGAPGSIRIGEPALYVASEQAVEVDPSVMPDMRSLENTLVHELAHHWQASQPAQYDAFRVQTAGKVPLEGSYGEQRGERDEAEAVAQEMMIALDFLITTESTEMSPGEIEAMHRAILHQYPGAENAIESLSGHPRFAAHPMFQQGERASYAERQAEQVGIVGGGVAPAREESIALSHQQQRMNALFEQLQAESTVRVAQQAPPQSISKRVGRSR